MNVIHHLLLAFAINLTAVSGAWAIESNPDQKSLKWHVWSPEIFELAQREGRLVLLDLTARWCQFCLKMDAITYRDPEVVRTINRNFIPVRADEADYPELGKRYESFGRPATIVFDGHGNEIIKKRGYLKPQWMVWFLEAVAENPSPDAHR